MRRLLLLSLLSAVALPCRGQLELQPGDRISVVGSALADRLQHEGTFEAMLHSSFPQHALSVRHLGFAGDELTVQTRSENFGSMQDWLKRTKADVVFAFWGFNESFRGAEGLAKFKEDLTAFVKEQQKAKYNGKSAPRVVLFSPAAAENLESPDFPDGAAMNERLALYKDAMREVAAATGVTFVDLFQPSLDAYAAAQPPLTVNGIHLRNEGYAALAPAMFRGLFGKDATLPDGKLMQAVNAKNWQWHQRYRTVDGFNVYGGRSQLAFPQGKGQPDLKNYTVMQQEMAQRDVLTENKEKRVHAIAQGSVLEVTETALPPVTSVKTNKPGPNPDKSHPYPTGEEVIAKVKVHEGLKMNLFADEQMFPELVNPVQMAWDTRGRLWVAAWPSYPGRTPDSKVGDKLLVLEDTDHDGRADKCTPFLDDLNSPTGFQFWNDGVLVMQAPDLWFVRDTDGDGKGDTREVVLNGMDSADSHHTTNAMCLDPGGAVYLSDGVFHRTQVETFTGPARHADGCIWRYEPRTGKFAMHIPYGFANPHGRVFDRWGNDLVTDATGNNTYFGPAISGWLSSGKHKGVKEIWERPSRPCPATGIVSSRHFPDDWQGNFLNLNVIGFQGIYRVKLEYKDSGIEGTRLPDLLEGSSTETFRPICISNAPDGSLYFCDWSQSIIGHMQHHLRDPNRDHQHGRIYRLIHEGRPLLTPKKVHGETVENLVKLLAEPEDGVRERAKIELGTRPSPQVLAAVMTWVDSVRAGAEAEKEHHLTEALWVHQWHNTVNLPLLHDRLASPEPHARAAAVRVALYWRDRVPEVLAILKTAARDEHPRVRLEAVRAASYFDTWEAADAALGALTRPTDYYIDYVLGETLQQLEPQWRKAIAESLPLAAGNAAGVQFLMGRVDTADLLKLPKSALTYEALLTRADAGETRRLEALSGLAVLNGTTAAAEAVRALAASKDEAATAELAHVLARQPAADLKSLRDAITPLTAADRPAAVREAGMAALMAAEGSTKAAWEKAQQSAAGLREFLGAVILSPDPELRKAADANVRSVFTALPDAVAKEVDGKTGTQARYIRISLPRTGTLTLAEVEVMSGGKNIASSGKATQKNEGHGGVASRAIDGNKSPAFGAGGQTHTHEDTSKPWWELDLGRVQLVDSVTIYNRGEDHSMRLQGYTLSLLDAARGTVWEKKDNPADEKPATHTFDTDPSIVIYRRAMDAIVTTGVQQPETFALLANEVETGREPAVAAQAMLRLPRSAWREDAARAAVISLLDWARRVPADDRTAPAFLEAVQATSELAGALPGEQCTVIRKSLRELSVSVHVIKTVPEQMRYNTARLVVEAGKPFEIIIENADHMPHNLVIAEPGSREEIGNAAQTMTPEKLDKDGRAWVPESKKIIAATKMLESGQSGRLKLTAPKKEGSYEMVCTFPGHWMVMWGKLVVTKDVDAYLAKHPQPEELPPTFAQPEPEKK